VSAHVERGTLDVEVVRMMDDSSTLWRYPDTAGAGGMTEELEGFKVEATDGEIGKIDEATTDVGASYIVVDTGPWIFGKKVVLPAGVIDRIDLEDNRVTVRLTKDQIKGSPEYDADTYRTPDYRTRLGSYYSDARM
jgi:hypothetical protein